MYTTNGNKNSKPYGYKGMLSLLQDKAKTMLSKRSNNSSHLDIQNIPSGNKELNDWAMHSLALIKDSLNTQEDINDLILILLGLIASERVNHTPEQSQFAAIRMYCKTNGLIQELLSMMHGETDDDSAVNLYSSYFSNVGNQEIVNSLYSLYNGGYTVWPEPLKSITINDLSNIQWMDRKWNLVLEEEQTTVFNGCIRKCQKHFVKASTNLDITDKNLARIANDQKLKAVIDSYLGNRSTLRSANLWITKPSERNIASSEAAQMFHYDLDTFKWLKVFIYLSNVDKESGAHCALPGTHIPGTKHPNLTAKLYSRITDDELDYYQSEKPVIFSGQAGTIIIGDTKAYHKGLPTKKGKECSYNYSILVQALVYHLVIANGYKYYKHN